MTETRFIWANTRGRQIVGSVWDGAAEPTPGQGTTYRLAPVQRSEALAAFDLVQEDPGFFALETREHSRIDFHFSRGWLGPTLGRLFRRPVRTATLEIWFEEDPEAYVPDMCSLDIGQARAAVEDVYSDLTDEALWRSVLARAHGSKG